MSLIKDLPIVVSEFKPPKSLEGKVFSVALEGVDNVGKSSLIDPLMAYFLGQGVNVMTLCPYGTKPVHNAQQNWTLLEQFWHTVDESFHFQDHAIAEKVLTHTSALVGLLLQVGELQWPDEALVILWDRGAISKYVYAAERSKEIEDNHRALNTHHIVLVPDDVQWTLKRGQSKPDTAMDKATKRKDLQTLDKRFKLKSNYPFPVSHLLIHENDSNDMIAEQVANLIINNDDLLRRALKPFTKVNAK